MRRFRRVRGRRFSRWGVVRYGTVRSCPALRCPGTGASRCARDLPSRKPPFSAFLRFAVWKTALLGIPTICRLENRPSRCALGAGRRAGPRFRADRRRIPEPSAVPRSSAGPSSPGAAPGRPSPPRTATFRTRNPANADNRRFRGARPFARERSRAWGSGWWIGRACRLLSWNLRSTKCREEHSAGRISAASNQLLKRELKIRCIG